MAKQTRGIIHQVGKSIVKKNQTKKRGKLNNCAPHKTAKKIQIGINIPQLIANNHFFFIIFPGNGENAWSKKID